VLVTDLPPEEAVDLSAVPRAGGDRLDLPACAHLDTREDRLGGASGTRLRLFHFADGGDGVRDSLPGDLEAQVRRVREVCDLPVAVGFGISRPEQVRTWPPSLTASWSGARWSAD